ncbi:hypothetical protein PLICRDRAFT_89155 [Plicaturopsis crispa FD-325 SS-3]|nr:hypothetical protein PLICRDRAFT_89155 [Plicaturopsis crispa FD-325 SS-3]
MGRRKRSEALDSDESEAEYSPVKKQKQKRNVKAPTPPTKASIMILATDVSPDKMDVHERLEKIDAAVLGRIKKALALASHEGTGEQEAKAALRMASKLMAQYSVTQADILSQETDAEKLKRAGTSVVAIKSTKSNSVNLETWAMGVAHAITTFFDCQVYTERIGDDYDIGRVQFCFYGLAEQTVAAAYAFEMVYNLVMTWSLQNAAAVGRHRKHAYRMGVAHGLEDLANKEKKDERKKAITREQNLLQKKVEEERAEDQKRIARLQDPPNTSDVDAKEESGPGSRKVKEEQIDERTKVKIEEVEDEDEVSRPLKADPHPGPSYKREAGSPHASMDLDDPPEDPDRGDFIPGLFAAADFDEDGPSREDCLDDSSGDEGPLPDMAPSASMPPPAPPAKVDEDAEEVKWNSVNQLVAFREASVAIGDEYLKSTGLKLRKGRKSKPLELKDYDARQVFEDGKRDAKKIDVRGRRIEGAERY